MKTPTKGTTVTHTIAPGLPMADGTPTTNVLCIEQGVVTNVIGFGSVASAQRWVAA